jgi:hypothetical protein
VILFVRGEFGLATAPHFEAALTAHLRRQSQTLSVDLCAVTFLGCSGLNPLLRPEPRQAQLYGTAESAPSAHRWQVSLR